MDQTRLSVIIPVFNKAAYLENLFRSLNHLPADAEIIFVDDGSTDASLLYIESHLVELAPRSCRVVTQGNCGVSVARNNGIEIASGDYIGFVDPDDEICSAMANLDWSILNEQADFVFMPYMRRKGSRCDLIDYPEFPEGGCAIEDVRTIACATGRLNSCWAKLYKRSLIIENNVRFPTGIKNGEDVSFNLKYLKMAKSSYYCSFPMIVYNVNPESVSANLDSDVMKDAFAQVQTRTEFYHSTDATINEKKFKAFLGSVVRDSLCAYARGRSMGDIYRWVLKTDTLSVGPLGWRLGRAGALLFSLYLRLRGVLAVFRRTLLQHY